MIEVIVLTGVIVVIMMIEVIVLTGEIVVLI